MTNKTTTTLGPLDATLQDTFKKLFRGGKKHIRELAVEAFEVHRQHYRAEDRRYNDEFETWWNREGMNDLFGTRTDWTKWYRAGEAIEKVQAQYVQHIHQLPLSRDALYEIAMLRPDEMFLCFRDHFTRHSVIEPEDKWKWPKTPKPVINPKATAASIRNWRKRWRQPLPPRTEKRTLPFITIHIDRSLYDFDKSGRHMGLIGPGQAVEINQKVIDLLKPLDAFLRVNPKLETLLEGYDRRRVAAEKRMQKSGRRTQIEKKKGTR
jgi:hypothetical protein